MHFPTLLPLGLGPSPLANAFALSVLCAAFSNPRFSHASDSDSITPSEDYHPLTNAKDQSYEPEFPGIARSIIGRAGPVDPQPLQNNVPGTSSILGGQTQYWVFPQDQLEGTVSTETPIIPPSQDKKDTGLGDGIRPELKRRQQEPRYYASLSICSQPSPNANTTPSGPPPGLQLFISTTPGNTNPGPDVLTQQSVVPTSGGYVEFDNPTSGDTYFGVSAPANSGFSGNYTYQLTVSIDGSYTNSFAWQSLYAVDSGTNTALFVTGNLTNSSSLQEQWMNSGSPFSIFIHNQNDTQITGLLSSWCGLNNSAQIKGNIKTSPTNGTEVGMTTIGGGFPKQQFYVQNLNGSSDYFAVMALETNYTSAGSGNVGGGGTVWAPITFSTKSDGNCQVIYNLTFCDMVTYAVPANPNNFPNMSSLANQYDNSASEIYVNFENSLDQVPCDTTSESQYSLATTCDDCKAAYKQWLCAVTIPRCEDYSANDSFLQPRNINQRFINNSVPSVDLGGSAATGKIPLYMNSSRNPVIDAVIAPGPYKELLPCQGLCYDLVQSCPSVLGFACPLHGKGLEHSYGSVTVPGVDPGTLTCNIPGALWGVSGASIQRPSLVAVVVASVVGLSIIGVQWN